MASESQIKIEIENIVNGKYSLWTIGVTDNPEERKGAHGNPPTWHQWNPNSEEIARSIEKYFLDKGMKGGGGGPGDADYVYIF